MGDHVWDGYGGGDGSNEDDDDSRDGDYVPGADGGADEFDWQDVDGEVVVLAVPDDLVASDHEALVGALAPVLDEHGARLLGQVPTGGQREFWIGLVGDADETHVAALYDAVTEALQARPEWAQRIAVYQVAGVDEEDEEDDAAD